jgi:hypothetical protein
MPRFHRRASIATAHALPPSGNGWRIVGPRGVTIAVLVARRRDGCVDFDAGFFQSLNVIEFGVASIGQMLAWIAGVASLDRVAQGLGVRGRCPWFFLPGLFLFQFAFPRGGRLLLFPERPLLAASRQVLLLALISHRLAPMRALSLMLMEK